MTDVACSVSCNASVLARVSRSDRFYADDAHVFIDFRDNDVGIVA